MTRKADQSDGGNGSDDGGKGSAQFAGSVRDSASQIWLAGLGAFAKAQEEGGKVFDTLVKQGQALQRKTQPMMEETLAEASARMAGVASDISSRASGQWGKLETIFEDRVALALNKMGVPSAKDVDALAARIEELHRMVAAMAASKAPPAKAPGKRTRSASRPATAKRPARKTAI
ncbi:MAG: phasin family protein [Ramlibacter sp.]